MKPDRITWPVVALVSVAVAAVVVLALAGVDTGDVMTVLLALGVGGSYAGIQAVRQNTNGTMSDMMRTMQSNQAELTRLVRESLEKLSKSPAIVDKEE